MSIGPEPGQARPETPARRARAALLRRPRRGQALAALLCGLLAFALVTQVHSNSSSNGLRGARSDDLLAILANLQGRADRLRQQVADLQVTADRLRGGSAGAEAALAEARRRAQTLGILTGTIGASGPGVVLTVTDPRRSVHADILVDAIEELRDAGAEALELGSQGHFVRIVASTAAVDDAAGGVDVDGRRLSPPYRLLAIGDPRTLASALAIPGGVVDSVAGQAGAHAAVATSNRLTITALRAPRTPRYARPAPTSSP